MARQKLVFDILDDGLANSLDGLPVKLTVLGFAFFFGWGIGLVSIRGFGNLALSPHHKNIRLGLPGRGLVFFTSRLFRNFICKSMMACPSGNVLDNAARRAVCFDLPAPARGRT